MKCPHCQRTLWKPFARAVATPKTDGFKAKCPNCVSTVSVQLPEYLTAQEYVAFGGFIVGTGLALLLTVDVPVGLRVQMLLSGFALVAGLVALLTYTNARVR